MCVAALAAFGSSVGAGGGVADWRLVAEGALRPKKICGNHLLAPVLLSNHPVYGGTTHPRAAAMVVPGSPRVRTRRASAAFDLSSADVLASCG
jgi:hypothetical protein